MSCRYARRLLEKRHNRLSAWSQVQNKKMGLSQPVPFSLPAFGPMKS